MLTTTQKPENRYDRYHAHVYFDAQTVERATRLCLEAGRIFDVAIGRVHRQPVGPHPYWSCQITFEAAQFDDLIAWLDQHRDGLNVLVHGLTGDDLADHTAHASWLGEAQPLKLDIFHK